MSQQTAELSERLKRVEEAIRDGRMIAAPGAEQDGEKVSGKAGDADRREAPKLVAPELFSRIQGQWKNTLQAMKDPGTGSIMANLAEPWYNSSDQETLYVAFDDDWVKAYRDNQKVKEEFQDILEAKYGVRPEVRFVSKCEMQQRTDSVRVQDAAKIEGIDFPIEEED